MVSAIQLRPTALLRRCDPQQFDFETTADLEDLTEVIGQARALEALHFAAGIRRDGYNLFALGPSGTGKHTTVRRYLEQRAGREQTPADWCYVHNFDLPHKPQALRLPNGRGSRLSSDMARLVEDLRSALPVAFETEEYHAQAQQIRDDFKSRREQALGELAKQAQAHDITLLRTPGGFAFAPERDGEVIDPEQFDKLPPEQQREIEQTVAELQERLTAVLHQMPQWQREAREKIETLNRDVAQFAVANLIDEVRHAYADLTQVLAFLDRVQADVIDHADQFLGQEEGAPPFAKTPSSTFFRRYQVNVVVDHGRSQGAPVVYEDMPVYPNLVGRVEHRSEMGALTTDFTLIKSGALHRANGGYLLLDAHKLLLEPFAWEGLKRALRAREVRIESLGQIYSLVSTVSLEPEPIALELKVVLLGERLLYYLLCDYDPDFAELFKVAADFEDDMQVSPEGLQLYARLIAGLARRDGLLAFHREAVARVIEHAARLSEDSERVTTHLLSVADLLREADHWARQRDVEHVQRADVQKAIDMQIRRADRLRERIYAEIIRGTLLIDTQGRRLGQVNGISVIELGGFAFGQPARISATARLGEGDIIDIERETELGGAIHSKGVFILSAYLASRYCVDKPLSLAASLVFEQSYAMIEGDSASVAELCALLSALAQAPLRQDLAVTGSVNQYGEVQAIGGVNEKIEGFYDICAARGLSGQQGVLIPRANVVHLMLREDVVQAVADGRFAVYAIDDADQAIELLTGVAAGEVDEQGVFPESSINRRVSDRLTELADIRHEFAKPASEGGEDGADGDHPEQN